MRGFITVALLVLLTMCLTATAALADRGGIVGDGFMASFKIGR